MKQNELNEIIAKHHELACDDDMPDTFKDLLMHLEKIEILILQVKGL